MATETFRWPTESGESPDIKYRVKETKFGDGYTQTYAEGINNKEESYTIKVTCRKSQAVEILDFFDRQAGWKSFFWTSPLGTLGLYRCQDPKHVNIGGDKYSITGTFVKAFSAK